ncbi:MAG TPA: hypothetical protein VFS43_08140 [Polyangiaceae bacterium]|nr:hypothetical protein [Polyangiaceae bacterium]
MTSSRPTASEARPRRRFAPSLALALAFALPAAGCGRGCSNGDAPASAGDVEGDRGRLRDVLRSDVAVSQTLHRADQAMALSQRDEAQRLVLVEAKPVAAENVRRVEGLAPSTAWGKARRAELDALLRDREKSLDEYAAAMTSGDVQRVLDALEQQRDIERRAVALAQQLEPAP